MLLSRIGRNCKVVISGDPEQADIKDSGLDDAVYRLRNIEEVGVVKFEHGDIVRSKMCKEVILAYRS
jgi:phosphate starvation-inducible PhoH-like protein